MNSLLVLASLLKFPFIAEVIIVEPCFLIPLNDQEKMASSILELLNNSELIDKFGINGYNEVKKNFSLNKMLTKHRNYLANL